MLYQIALAVGLLLAAPPLLLRRARHYLPTLPPRFGIHHGKIVTGAVWIHAVSVGEVAVARTLAERLADRTRLLITTVTPTGQERARAAFAERAVVTYLPFDLGLPIRRFLDRYRPASLILVEGEFWPLLLRSAKRRHLPVVLVNGRISDRSYSRLRRVRPLLGALFGGIDRFGVQSEQDRSRLADLGVEEERIVVTGNLKYESPEPPPRPALEAELQRLAQERPVLVAGSTMPDEEEKVLAGFSELGGGERALLVLAPRHPERFDGVWELIRRQGFGGARRSRLETEEGSDVEVLLLDSLGELAALYRYSNAAFIGGTLVPTGGHNPLEAARFGVPVAVGPSMENFHDMARSFDEARAWERVADAAALGRVWRHWLVEPSSAAAVSGRALELIDRHRGAGERTLALLHETLGDV